MSCPYFKEGYVGVCVASESMYVPSINKLETNCFSEEYRCCTNLAAYLCGRGTGPGTSRGENRTLMGLLSEHIQQGV
jgi:hypothetical protein